MEVFGLFGRSFACGLGAILGAALGTVIVVGIVGAVQPPPNLIAILNGGPGADDMKRWQRIGEPEPEPEPEPS